jgi:hypothetical protein
MERRGCRCEGRAGPSSSGRRASPAASFLLRPLRLSSVPYKTSAQCLSGFVTSPRTPPKLAAHFDPHRISLRLLSSSMLAAVAQLCSRSSVAQNLLLCKSVIRRASGAGAQLLWLPEASDFIAAAEDVPRLSRPLDKSDFIDGIKASAVEERIWVGVGVHESAEATRCYNTNLVSSFQVDLRLPIRSVCADEGTQLISPEGVIVQAYRKVIRAVEAPAED